MFKSLYAFACRVQSILRISIWNQIKYNTSIFLISWSDLIISGEEVSIVRDVTIFCTPSCVDILLELCSLADLHTSLRPL